MSNTTQCTQPTRKRAFFLSLFVGIYRHRPYIAGKTKTMTEKKTTKTTQKPVKQQYMYLRLKPSAHKALKTYAAQQGVTMSQAIEHLVFLAAKM